MNQVIWTDESIRDSFWDDSHDTVVIVPGEWINDYKTYCHKTVIVKHNETGQFFQIDCVRTGSYDYEYMYHPPVEVKQVEKMVKQTVWEEV